MHTRSVFGLAVSRNQAEQIVQELVRAKLDLADLSVLFLDPNATPVAVTGETAAPVAAVGPASAGPREPTFPIAGLTPLVIPSFPPLQVAGPLAAALSPATIGGVAGGLVDFGVPELEALRYEQKIKDGGVLCSYRSENPDQSDRCRTIFRSAGAEDVRTVIVVISQGILRSARADSLVLPANLGWRRPRRGRPAVVNSPGA